MTSSAGASGLISCGLPPRRVIASRMAAEVDHRRHAGEVLHDHARRGERDLVARGGLGVPVEQRLDVLAGHADTVLGAQQVLEQDLQREGQSPEVVALEAGRLKIS